MFYFQTLFADEEIDLWIRLNFNIRVGLKSDDRLPRRKFEYGQRENW